MKTAISIPDDLFDRVEEFARDSGKSRSQVYREALAEYLLRRDTRGLTQAMDEALAEIDETSNEWLAEAGREVLEQSEW
jgi:metal-responsive CopG/Arc/MetJ family transcriptional regulator